MSKSNRSIFKSGLFWLALLSFIFAVLFIIFGEYTTVSIFDNLLTRLLYGSVFFLSIIIAELLYLFLTKEEERESRRLRREAMKEERQKEKEQRQRKKSAIVPLEKKFYEALSIIKKSNIYSKRTNYNYELPWYLLLGGDDEEQKAILRNSGLDFPINIEYKEDEASDTGAFQWFFAEEGVFVTVPKSYVTLNKNSDSHPIWLAFLKLFKKERWRRPINGIIFTLNAGEISNNDTVDLHEFSKVVREKLDEISKTFSSTIPIYMIITGLESIPTFQTFFANLTSEEKREVLGFTFDENVDDINQSMMEFKVSNLLQKLENETVANLQNSWDKTERKEIFFFLAEFHTFLSKVTGFTVKTFAKTRFHIPLMLRGVYFTDITKGTSSQYAMTAPGSVSTSGLFLPKVFERIILSETQLVQVNDNYRKKFATVWLSLFALLIAGLAFVIFFWTRFIQEEYKEIKVIEDTYKQYQGLKNHTPPKIIVERTVHKPKNSLKIGKLGGESGVSFGKGNAALKPFAELELSKIAQRIGTLDQSTKFKIIGHTDSIGDESSNNALSKARAASVKAYFIDNGIEASRISIEGSGESNPIANNQTVEGRSLNRRVEIYAYGNKQETHTPAYEEKYEIDDSLNDLQRILGMLDALKSMRRESGDAINKEAWKPGFFKVAQRDTLVHNIYNESLERLLLPRVATLIEKSLLSNRVDKLTIEENLAAYLMLADKEHRKNESLEAYMASHWGDDLEKTETRRLNAHFSALLKLDFAPAKLEAKSINRARKHLLTYAGSAGLLYENLQKKAQIELPYDFQFINVLDAYPDALTGADYSIPGFYTKEGYEKIILVKTKFIIDELMLKSWILGEDADKAQGQERDRLYKTILGLYFKDYRKKWSEAFAQLNMPAYYSSTELSEQLELLSSSVSPVILVLRALKENTYLYTPKEKAEIAMREKEKLGITGAEVAGRLGSRLDRIQRLGTKTMQAFASDEGVYALRDSFKSLHSLIDKSNRPSPKFQNVLKHVEKVYRQMLEVDTSADSQKSAYAIVKKKGSSSHKTFALNSKLLPHALLVWYNRALDNSWNYLVSLVDGHLDKTYNNKIWQFYSKKIQGRFPLDLQSNSEVTLDDFKLFFKKEGLLDQFYTSYVLPFVTIDALTGTFKIKTIDGAKIAINEQMVQSMLHAKEIQKLFFKSGSGELHVSVNITPVALSSNLSAMDIAYEDKSLLYEHGPLQSTQFIWPVKSSESLAKFTFYDLKSARVVKVRGRGAWALLKLFMKLRRQINNTQEMTISYSKKRYKGTFKVSGDIIKIFTEDNPLEKFELKKK